MHDCMSALGVSSDKPKDDNVWGAVIAKNLDRGEQHVADFVFANLALLSQYVCPRGCQVNENSIHMCNVGG